MELKLTNKSLLDVIDHGLEEMKGNDCDAFDYIIGEVNGKKLQLSLLSNEVVSESIVIDGVDGLGYCLVCESNPQRI